MSALDLLGLVNRLLFVGLFLAVAWRATRQPSSANLHTALLFGSVAAAVVTSAGTRAIGLEAPWVRGLVITLLNAAPWAMILLVDDFSGSPRWVVRAGTVAFMVLAAFGLLAFATAPVAVQLATIAWFLIVGGYAAIAFGRASRRNRGITRVRMAAVAVGAYLFIATVVLVFAGAILPDASAVLGFLGQLGALAAVSAFFVGFAPPAWLRRAWREPDLRGFLERSLHLTGVVDDRAVVLELQRAAADTLGAPGAGLGIASADATTLSYTGPDGEWVRYPADTFVAGRAFTTQTRIIATDAARADPEHAEMYEAAGASAVIAVPVTAESRRIGVLTVYGDRAPVFSEDDLWLIQLLADHVAMIMEARRMAREASELRGREETTLLKEEFLSSAAHDLRTPLTVLLGQAELLERRLQRDPESPIDPAGVMRIVRETRRLSELVSDLLDAQRLQDGGAARDRRPMDLRELIEATRERHRDQGTSFETTLTDVPLVAAVDRIRLEQVLDNLLENASKYAPPDDRTEVHAWADGDEAHIAVVDHGIGIPASERTLVFDRFFRASNAQARSDTGLGLGLYICRRIVESHGGRIWTEETPGGGSTFHVALPLVADGTMDAQTADGLGLADTAGPIADA